MKLKSIMKIIFGIGLLANSFFTFADDIIPCPSSILVKNSAQRLNTIETEKPVGYYVYTNLPTIYDSTHNLWWSVVSNVTAPNFDQAFAKSQLMVSMVTNSMKQNALNLPNIYVCGYVDSNSDPVSVLAIARKHSEGNKFVEAFSNFRS